MVACVMPLKARLVLRLLHYAMRGGLMCLGELLFYNLYLFKTVHKHTHTHTHTHKHTHTHTCTQTYAWQQEHLSSLPFPLMIQLSLLSAGGCCEVVKAILCVCVCVCVAGCVCG